MLGIAAGVVVNAISVGTRYTSPLSEGLTLLALLPTFIAMLFGALRN